MKNFRIVITGILILLGQVIQAQTVDLINYNFASNCALPAGWRIENVDGSCTWRCVASVPGGIYQENHNTALPSGCSGVANDWLITPALPLNNYRNEKLIFNAITQYVGGGVALKYSTNYPGTGNPGLYTWTQLLAAIPAGTSNVDISGIAGDSVYIAFHYTSIGSGNSQASRWMIADVVVKGEQSVVLSNPSHRSITSSSAILGAELVNDGGLAITERGILWSTATNPTLATSNTTKVQRQGGIGIYDTLAAGLPVGTLIYYRGYARTAGLDFYSPVSSFYTLANEPSQHATGFTATALGSNAIALNWSQVPDAKGYLILQKTSSSPSALPLDATAYTAGAVVGDATVAAVINTNTVEKDTIRNLLAGTRYYFTLIPFGINASANAGTYNYLTSPVVPSANDSTTGVPTSYFSDITGIAGSESGFISSVENTTSITVATEGALVWKLALRDGGSALNDPDALPTIFNAFTLTPAVFNTASWQTMIQSVALFDDSTGNKTGTATVSANGIQFNGLNLVAADNNFRTVSIRLSLNKGVALPEQTAFQFTVMDTSVKTQSAIFSSQKGNFVLQSAASANKIRVSASRIRIITQPPALVEAGVVVGNVSIELVDAWNNPDMDTVLNVQVRSVLNNLSNTGINSVVVLASRAVFNRLIFNNATGADTLVFEAGSLIPVKSTRVRIKNSSSSDIVATPGFVYARAIPYIRYLDIVNLTTTNTFPVFGFTVRDGASQMNDADSASTVITGIKLSVTNFNQLKTIALFDSSNNRLAEIPVTSADAEFTNLNLVTADNGSNKLQVRATFNKVVTDGARLQFKIALITYKNDTLSSQFIAADGGAALSSTVSFENKIEVSADKLVLAQQPLLSYANEVIYPAVKLRATDSLGNTDMEGRIIKAQALSGTLEAGSVTRMTLSPANGSAEFNKIAYADTITATQLRFTDGTLSVVSNTFDVINPAWYRSLKSGSWDSLSTWEYSADKGLNWFGNPALVPDASKHGEITIRNGHTVVIGGGLNETFKIDETVVEAGAVLITPVLPGKTLEVMNGRGEDLVVYGTLKHTNSSSVSGIINQAGSNVSVMPGGMIELAANGYAANWAANPLIVYKNNAVYYHHTTQTNAIAARTYFASTPANEIPVFRFGSPHTFRSAPAEQLSVNGVTDIEGSVSVSFGGSGSHIFRNGFSGNGNITFYENAANSVNGTASISGNGMILINDNAKLTFTSSSVITLAGNKIVNSNTNSTLAIEGYFNSNAYTISGTAGAELKENAWFVTAHAQGVKGSLAGTGALLISADASFDFNADNLQQRTGLPETGIAGLIVSNPYGVLLTEFLHVGKKLDLSGGSLITSGNGNLSITEKTTLLNYNASRFINGKVRIKVEEQVFLPIGKKQVYAPVSIRNRVKDSSLYEIEYFDTLITTAATGTLKSISLKERWNINRLEGNNTAKFTLTHHAVTDAGEGLPDLRVASLANNIGQPVGPRNRNATQTMIETDYITPSGIYAIAIDQSCVAPAVPVVLHDTVCYGTPATLAASSAVLLTWYASSDGETSIFNGNNVITGPLFSDTAFYVESRQLSCASTRVKLDVTVTNALNKPTLAANTVQVCKSNVLTLTANGQQPAWFSDAGLTKQLAQGNTFVSGAIEKDTVFYVAASKSGCLSLAQAVTVFTKNSPEKPFTTDVTVCKGSTAVLSASSNASAINWYTSLTQLAPFVTADHISIKEVLTDTAFYTEASEGQCVSGKVKVNVVVARVPAVPVINDLGVACKGSAITLHATSGSDNIRWFLSDIDTTPVYTGSSFTTEALNRNTLFFVDASNTTCSSAKLSFPVSVLASPFVSGIRAPKSVNQYDSVIVVTESNRADEYNWNFGNDAEPSVAVGPGPHYVKWITSGNQSIRLTVSNKLGAFSCTKEFDTLIYVSPSTGLSEYASGIRSTVYPNPANTLLHISATFTSAEAAKISLTDAVGKMVWTSQATGSSMNYTGEVDVRGLSDGVYLLSIEAGGMRKTQRVFISK